MKGVELPINVLIIVVVAIIVLIALVALFFPAFNSGSGTVSSETAMTTACQIFINRDCNVHPSNIAIYDFDADNDGNIDPRQGGSANCGGGADTGDNLWSLCVCQFQIPQSTAGCQECKRLCGCRVTNC